MNLNTSTLGIIIAYLCSFPLSTQAEAPSYDYLSLDFVNAKVEGVKPGETFAELEDEVDFKGVQFKGSTQFHSRWFTELNYFFVQGDAGENSSSNFGFLQQNGEQIGLVTQEVNYSYDFDVSTLSGSIGYLFYEGQTSNAYLALGFWRGEIKSKISATIQYRETAGGTILHIPGVLTSSDFNLNRSASDSGPLFSLGYRKNLNDSVQLGFRVDHVRLDDSATKVTAEVLYWVTEKLALQANVYSANDEIQLGFGSRFEF